MADSRDLLRSTSFWLYYHLGRGIDTVTLQQFVPVESSGEGYSSFSIHCPCPYPFAMYVEVLFDFYTINLSLLDRQKFKHCELGWWDDARWHPFALRWEELERLVAYWGRHPDSSIASPTERLLLLARFVGHGADESADVAARRERVAAAYRGLALFSPSEIEELVAGTIVLPTEDDYRWTKHDELGWVFSGEYPCYSIRNAEHAGGQEGRFPFRQFACMMEAVGQE